MYDEEEAGEYWEEDAADENDGDKANVDEQDNVVISGDAAAAAAAAGKTAPKSMKERKIATEDRTTTPYMTKYEKARILGTRALQIR